jgi:hypothetical protein
MDEDCVFWDVTSDNLIRTGVSEDLIVSIIRVERISENHCGFSKSASIAACC